MISKYNIYFFNKCSAITILLTLIKQRNFCFLISSLQYYAILTVAPNNTSTMLVLVINRGGAAQLINIDRRLAKKLPLIIEQTEELLNFVTIYIRDTKIMRGK